MDEMRKNDAVSVEADRTVPVRGKDKPEYLHSLTAADKWLPAGALAFGILFVWLLYGKLPGISVPLLTAAFYLLLFSYARPVMKKDAKFGWFLCLPISLLSLSYLFFGNNVFRLLNLLAIPVLVLLQTLLVADAARFSWFSPGILIDLLYGMFYRCLAHIPKPFGIFSAVLRRSSGENGTRSVASRILFGLLFSLPLLLILLALLASADMVFGNMIDKLANLLEIINLENLIGKLIAALAIFLLSFSYLWSLAHREKLPESALNGIPSSSDHQKGFWDPVMVITVIAVVNLLYLVFAVIQFAYLFGGSGLPDGFTYSEYARKGFFELIFVTMLNIGLLACILTFTRKAGEASTLVLRLLNTILICCTFVMLYSAHFRMSLYEEAYGYTFLRIMTHAFMGFLLILFVITLARVWKDGLPLLKPYIVTAVVAFVMVNYINVDMIIVNKNVERYEKTKVIDVAYFNTLSSDAVLKAASLVNDKNPDVSKAARDLIDRRKKQLNDSGHWQSFNLPDYKARLELGK